MNKNFCIILAGGVGSRLWPYSREHRPKQFLDLLGTGRTMLQLTYERYAEIVPRENIFVSTFRDYAPLVKEQLPDLRDDRLVSEPVQLGTAPATALVVSHIMAIAPDANVIVSPADQMIAPASALRQHVEESLAFVSRTPQFLVLGIKATSPETTFGYLQAGEEMEAGFARVKSFTEKPSRDFAQFFVDSGEFYWSTGLFVAPVSKLAETLGATETGVMVLAEMLRNGAEADEVENYINQSFPRNRFQALDFLILDKHEDVYICPCTFHWRDLGTWNGFYSISQKDVDGNVVTTRNKILYDSHNNMVMTSPNKLVLISDIDNCMLVEYDNIIMLCRRDDTARIRQMMTDARMHFTGLVDPKP